MIRSDKTYRVIFEFENTDQVQTLLEKIGVSLDSGTLKISGTWSWGAESVETFQQEKEGDYGIEGE